MVVAIIPARGGSKGVPRKNLRTIGGSTLLEIAILKCRQVCSQVIVSTEDRAIANEAQRWGARVHDRPEHLATDEASSPDVLRAVRDEFGLTGDIAFVQCTAPAMTTDDLSRCITQRGIADVSVLCHPFHGFVLGGRGAPVNRQLVPVPRRQDLQPQWLIAGSAWCFDASYLDSAFYTGKVRPVPCYGYHVDIDTEDDLRLARVLCNQRHEERAP